MLDELSTDAVKWLGGAESWRVDQILFRPSITEFDKSGWTECMLSLDDFVDVSVGNQWRPTAKIWCRCVEVQNSDRSIVDFGFKGNGPGVVPTRNPAVSATLLNNFSKTQLELHLEASNLHVSCVKNMFIPAST